MIEFLPNPDNPPSLAGTDEAYFVTVVNDNGAAVALAGPFDEWADAHDAVDEQRARAYACDPKAVWYRYGTCRTVRNIRVLHLPDRNKDKVRAYHYNPETDND